MKYTLVIVLLLTSLSAQGMEMFRLPGITDPEDQTANISRAQMEKKPIPTRMKWPLILTVEPVDPPSAPGEDGETVE